MKRILKYRLTGLIVIVCVATTAISGCGSGSSHDRPQQPRPDHAEQLQNALPADSSPTFATFITQVDANEVKSVIVDKSNNELKVTPRNPETRAYTVGYPRSYTNVLVKKLEEEKKLHHLDEVIVRR